MLAFNNIKHVLYVVATFPFKLINQLLSYRRYVYSDPDLDIPFKPPPSWFLKVIHGCFLYFHGITLINIKRVPTDKPLFFVLNHQATGLDMPIFFISLYLTTGRFPRPLCDVFHWYLPHKPLLTFFGGVLGTRENVRAMMDKGMDIAVYPGGGREICKCSTDKKYSMMWSRRKGFAQLAIEKGYTIMTVGGVGAEDCCTILFDVPITKVLKFIGVPERSQTHVGFAIPRLFTRERFYFAFGHPIDTSVYKRDLLEESIELVCHEAYNSVLRQVNYCLKYREGKGASKRFIIDYESIDAITYSDVL
eukprot:CFRG4341T1